MLERSDTESIKIAAFDVIERPHGQGVAFDTRNGSTWPDIGETTPLRMDSLFRYAEVKQDFARTFPENFYAERSNADVVRQLDDFNEKNKITIIDTQGTRFDYPLLRDIHTARLQADMRMIDTARNPNPGQVPSAPIMVFLSDLRRILFNWATLRLLGLATKANKDKYPFHDLYVVVLSGAVGISQDLILHVEQIPGIFNRLARFEAILRMGPTEEDANTFVPYLTTLAMAMDAGKSMSDLKVVSEKWIKRYEPRILKGLKEFLELES